MSSSGPPIWALARRLISTSIPGRQAIRDRTTITLGSYVKAGQALRFETTHLAPSLDTNLIVYRDNLQVIGGNDDCTPSERRSCLDWEADYTGFAFILVGPVGLAPKAVSIEASAYSLAVTDLATGHQTTEHSHQSPTATLVYGEPLPWDNVPPPATPIPVAPLPTPTSRAREIHIRAFSLVPPSPTAAPRQPLEIELTIYHDANDNQAPDIDEGVQGVSVRVLDSLTNRLLGQAFTDSQGYAQLFIAAPDTVRLSVAYLGFNQTIRAPGKPVQIRLPALHLPSLIP